MNNLIAQLEAEEGWDEAASAMMATPGGHKALTILCAFEHPLHNPFTESDPIAAAVRAGRREVIAALFRAAPNTTQPPKDHGQHQQSRTRKARSGKAEASNQ